MEKMKIIDGRVNWCEEWANVPDLVLHVTRIPRLEELKFDQRGYLYFAHTEEGYVRFFNWSGKGNDGGYGGMDFSITMLDGSKKTLRGPWSSGSYATNREGFTPCMEVSLADNKLVFDRGYTLIASHISISSLKVFMPAGMPGIRLARLVDGETGYVAYEVANGDRLKMNTLRSARFRFDRWEV